VSQLDQLHPAGDETRPRPIRWGRALAATAAVLTLGLGAAACSNDDDGADVRSSGPGAEDCPSGSASGSASGAASGSEASASGTATECEVVDGDAGVAGADGTATATLAEYTITVDPAEAAAGAVGFTAVNDGEEAHELVIARGTPDDIEVVDGAPDEAALGDALIGEIEAFPAGSSCEGTFELAAADYVLFCAIVETEDDGSVESHYEEGMVTTFTVG